MKDYKIVKYEGGLIKKISNQIEVTNKLLALSQPQLIPYRKKDKWGFCTPDKKIVIDCIFESVYPFNEGLGKVKLNNKYGFLNNEGKLIIDCNYDYVWWGFSNNVASVGYIGNNSKIINKKGENINNISYWYSYNEISEDLILIYKEGKYGFLGKSGNLDIDFLYKKAFSFSEDFAGVTKDNNSWGFIDKRGECVIDFVYSWVYGFVDGFCGVAYDNKYGFIDRKGKMVIKNNFDQVYYFSEGLSLVQLNNKMGFINRSGDIVIDCIYGSAFGFSENLASVEVNNKFGFINNKGEIEIDCIYDFNAATSKFSEGLAGISIRGKSGYINKNGNIAIPCKYKYIDYFENGIANVTDFSGNNGFISNQGVEYWED